MSTIDHERRRRARQMAEARWAFRFHLPIYLIVNAALVIIWFFTGPSNFPWPVFPIFFWGIGVRPLHGGLPQPRRGVVGQGN